ncbi:zinc finger, RING/FYVE/PHD-type containing protein, partial [Tanacetum coccineum]
MSNPNSLQQLGVNYPTSSDSNSTEMITPSSSNNNDNSGSSGTPMTSLEVKLTPTSSPIHLSQIDTCSICTRAWDQDGHRLCTLLCGHMFGSSCIAGWALKKNTEGLPSTCPYCNLEFKMDDVVQLYPIRLSARK